ncbi:MAG: ABC transporter permease [Lachnospiraceae bacterium]|nr:ABC transporter permease [Lachnospiraceae bacterium]
MKSNIITIMKKEFARFFKDRRMVFTTIFMPGILIYVMYSFMGQGLSALYSSGEDFIPQIYAENLPEAFSEMEGLPVEFITDTPKEEAMTLLEEEKGCHVVAVFPEDFTESVAAYEVSSGEEAPQVELYYKSTSTDSSTAYTMMQEILASYETSMVNKFDINQGEGPYDLASEQDMAGMMFSMMLPLLMMVFLFSGCMAIAPESIAGEKERGTIATLLVTPMKRSHLALGKIFSLSAIGLLSGLSSFIGTMLSLPKLMGGVEGVDAGVYQVGDYLLLLAVILSTALLLISLISIISAFAQNVKEATSWVTPLMIVVVVISITSMIDSFRASNNVMYLIPLYNSVQSMNGVFSFEPNVAAVVLTVVSNVVYTGICAGILTKMFGNERVVFSK